MVHDNRELMGLLCKDKKGNLKVKHALPSKNKYKLANKTGRFNNIRQKEPMILQSRLNIINKEIEKLIKEAKIIRKSLNKKGQPLLNEKYLNNPIYLYVLKLEQNRWYIGMTRNVDKRFKVHVKGKGASWTSLYKPIEVYYKQNTKLTNDAEVALMENELTLQYARDYGVDLVRGGGY